MLKPPFVSCAAILLTAFLGACGQDYNSNSGDENLGGGTPLKVSCGTPDAARLCTAITIIRKSCGGCHADMAAYETDAAWVSSGRVVAGKTASSTVFTRLINSGSDMPQGGSALPTKDYDALRAWIDQMPSAPAGG